MEEHPTLTEKTNWLTFSRVHSSLLWFTLSITYFLSSVRRYSIATWSDALVKDFQADATEFAALSFDFWYAYGILQIPCGIIMGLINRHADALYMCVVAVAFVITANGAWMHYHICECDLSAQEI